MLDTLIDTIETFNAQERLILLLSDLETYRNLQLLNDLLSKGHSMTDGPSNSDNQVSLDIIDDILFTDYQKVIAKEERGNKYQMGVLSRLNRIYFDQFLKPEWEVREDYKEEH